MKWAAAAAGQTLSGWDMIRTLDDGRVEIEIVRYGAQPIIDEANSVIAADGRTTDKLRLPEQTYLIMHPLVYAEARIQKVIGHVLVSSDRDEVKALFRKHMTLTETLGPRTNEELWRWRQSLSEPELQ